MWPWSGGAGDRGKFPGPDSMDLKSSEAGVHVLAQMHSLHHLGQETTSLGLAFLTRIPRRYYLKARCTVPGANRGSAEVTSSPLRNPPNHMEREATARRPTPVPGDRGPRATFDPSSDLKTQKCVYAIRLVGNGERGSVVPWSPCFHPREAPPRERCPTRVYSIEWGCSVQLGWEGVQGSDTHQAQSSTSRDSHKTQCHPCGKLRDRKFSPCASLYNALCSFEKKRHENINKTTKTKTKTTRLAREGQLS